MLLLHRWRSIKAAPSCRGRVLRWPPTLPPSSAQRGNWQRTGKTRSWGLVWASTYTPLIAGKPSSIIPRRHQCVVVVDHTIPTVFLQSTGAPATGSQREPPPPPTTIHRRTRPPSADVEHIGQCQKQVAFAACVFLIAFRDKRFIVVLYVLSNRHNFLQSTDHVRCQLVYCYLSLMQLQCCTTHIFLSVMWYTTVVVLIDNAIAMMYHCSSFNW
jgi:hypothetical protein